MIALLDTAPDILTECTLGEPLVLVKIIVPVYPRRPPSLPLTLAVSSSLLLLDRSPIKALVLPMGKALSGSSVENDTSKVDGDPAGKDCIWV
jgi:hypothetical protein